MGYTLSVADRECKIMLDVYKSIYKLTGSPFRLGPDHHFSFGHRSYDDAKSYLKYAINEGEGIVAITGSPGTGKTTLIASLVSELDDRKIVVGVVTNIQLDSASLLDMVVDAYPLMVDRSDHASIVIGFKHYLKYQIARGRRVILIVD